jgi:hypothetical protein
MSGRCFIETGSWTGKNTGIIAATAAGGTFTGEIGIGTTGWAAMSGNSPTTEAIAGAPGADRETRNMDRAWKALPQ